MKKEQGNHLTGPDQKPDQKRRTSSAHLPLTFSSKSSYQEEKCLGPGNRMEDDPWQTSTPKPPHPENCWIDPLACKAVWTCWSGGKNPEKFPAKMHLEICQEGAGILSITKCEMPCLQSREWLLCTTSTPFPGQGSIPATPGYDIWRPGLQLKQPQKTLANAKALQHLPEKAQPLTSGKLHPTGRKCAGTLTQDGAPYDIYWWKSPGRPLVSNWVRITPSKLAEPTPRECSHSRTHRTHARGSFLAAYHKGWSKASTTAQTVSQPAATAQEVKPKQEYTIHWWPSPSPGFAEIAWSLHGDNPPQVVTGIPPEVAKDQSPIQMVGSIMFSAQLFKDVTSRAMCIKMVTCSMNLEGVEIIPPLDDHAISALLDEEDSDWVPNCPSSAIAHPSSAVDHPSLVVLDRPCLACLPKCVSYVSCYSYIIPI